VLEYPSRVLGLAPCNYRRPCVMGLAQHLLIYISVTTLVRVRVSHSNLVPDLVPLFSSLLPPIATTEHPLAGHRPSSPGPPSPPGYCPLPPHLLPQGAGPPPSPSQTVAAAAFSLGRRSRSCLFSPGRACRDLWPAPPPPVLPPAALVVPHAPRPPPVAPLPLAVPPGAVSAPVLLLPALLASHRELLRILATGLISLGPLFSPVRTSTQCHGCDPVSRCSSTLHCRSRHFLQYSATLGASGSAQFGCGRCARPPSRRPPCLGHFRVLRPGYEACSLRLRRAPPPSRPSRARTHCLPLCCDRLPGNRAFVAPLPS
jgi:hypothetical protein